MAKKYHAQCFDGVTDISNVRRCIREQHPVLVIMRGLPGSGKSTISRELAQILPEESRIYSTDELFMVNEKYCHDSALLTEYHLKNQKRAKEAMENGVKLVIIDNTNIKIEHLQFYVLQGLRSLYEVYVLESTAPWAWKVSECARRNTHDMPKARIKAMADSYQRIYSFHHLLMNMGYTLKIQPPLFSVEESKMIIEEVIPESSTNNSDSDRDSGISSAPSEAAFKQINQELEALNLPEVVEVNEKKCSVDRLSPNNKKVPLGPPPGFEFKKNLFSLMPEVRVTHIDLEVRACGTQTNDCTTILHNAGYPIEQFVFEEEPAILKKEVTQKQTKEKGEQEILGWYDEMDLFVSLFPEQPQELLFHYYLLFGLIDAVRMMIDLNYSPEWENEPVPNLFCWETALSSESCTSIHGVPLPLIAPIEQPEVDPKRAFPAEVLNQMMEVPMDNDFAAVIYSILDDLQKMPSQFKPVQMRLLLYLHMAFNGYSLKKPTGEELAMIAAPDLPGLSTLEIESDGEERCLPINDEFMGLLDLLFGHQYPSRGFDRPLPYWLLRTFFVAIQPNNDALIKRSIESDEEFARRLQAEENRMHGIPNNTPRRALTWNEKLNLKELQEKFSRIEGDFIEELFYDYGCNASIIENMLRVQFGTSTSKERTYTPELQQFEKFDVVPTFPSLEEAQEAALVQREAATDLRNKEAELRRKAQTHRINPQTRQSSQHYINEANKYRDQAKEYEKQSEAILIKHNEKAAVLDFHGMLVKPAIATLKARLKSASRLSPQQLATSTRRLRVITGYGKSNDGKCLTKAAVKQYLDAHKYRYYMDNQGEFVVTY